MSTPRHTGADAARPLEFERIFAAVRGGLFERPVEPVKIGRYEVHERLGAGAMGLVYRGVDPELGRRVAIKLVRPELRGSVDLNAGQDRLLREAKAMAKVSSPNVVTVYDAGAYGEQVYVAMELVDGTTLRDWIAGGPRPWRAVIEMFLQAGHGLASVHAAGLVHRDFKPANVLIGRDGRARVADFGLAHAAHRAAATGVGSALDPSSCARITATGAAAGSAAYMAAERHLGGPADPRSDQFSFCVALYEALYGQRPFAGETIAEVRARVLAGAIQEPPGRARVPKRVRRVIMRGLAREPSQRYPDMAELLVALDQLRVPRWASLTPVAGAGLIGLLASLMVFQTSEPSERASEGLCEVEAELAGIWDDARRDALARAFTGTGRAYAGDVAAQVSARLDGYASSWLALRREACVDAWEDTGGELADGGREADDPASTSERTYLTMACLDRGRGELRALGDALLADPEGLIDNAVTAAYRLRALEPCASNPELALRGGGPRSPALQAKLSSIQSRVDELDALLKAGDYRRGLERGQRALEWARDIGHEPTTAEVLYFVGAFAAGARDYEAAERWLFEAAVTAERGDSYEVLARARTELVVVIGYRLGRHDEALRWGAMAGATVDQLGAGGLLETRLLNAVGLVHERRGDLESARAQIERALFVGRRSLGDDHPGVATTLDNLATVLDGLGRRDEALTRARAALALRERVLGPHHPDVAESLRHVAALERPRGDAPAPAP